MGSGGRPTSRRLSNKGCRLCREAATNVIHETTWWRNKWPPPPAAQVCSDLLCTGGDYSVLKGWEQWTLFCSEASRLRRKIILFKKAIRIGN